MVVAAEQVKPLTIEDLADYPDDGMRREIMSGELIVSPAPTPIHQLAVGELHLILSAFVRKHALGRVLLSPVDVRLSLTDVVEPDLIFIPNERQALIGGKFIDGLPDLVLEVLSPSTKGRDLVRKRALYAHSGIAEYWIVDPEQETLLIHELRNGHYELIPSEQGTARSKVLTGLSVNVAQLFAQIPSPDPD